MPWEKSFNEDDALEKAMRVFWQKGYDSASIADLINGTGINRGSLYNAFGGKERLFIRALKRYDQDRKEMLAELEALDDPRRAIEGFFEHLVSTTLADEEHKGCFLFNTAVDISSHGEKVQGIVKNGVAEIEGFFRRCIEVGQARGAMPAALDARDTAKALLGLTIGIRVLGRGVYPEDALRALATQATQLVEGQPER
ncbi:MAG: TetR/AcrR family transcriptional regulator [Pseudomonadota bacterium]